MYIQGFRERLEQACCESGMTKVEIAKRCGFDRKTLIGMNNNNMMHSGNLAKFCAVTGTDANWLLGIKGDVNYAYIKRIASGN